MAISAEEGAQTDDLIALAVESDGNDGLKGREEYILNATEGDTTHAVEGIDFSGIYGVACVNNEGFQYLYLGKGERLRMDGFGLDAMGASATACLYVADGKYILSSDRELKVTLKYPEGRTGVAYTIAYQKEGTVETAGARLADGSLEFVIEPVYRTELRITTI